jgi:hypothetical protein
MERFVQQYLNDRTECFDDHYLTCQKEDCNIYAACVELAENVLTVSEYGC